MRLSQSNRGRRRAGVAAVEFAVTALVFFVLVFAVFEYGRYVMTRNLVENAAREGARFATVRTRVGTDQQVKDAVTQYLAGQTVANFTVQVYKVDLTTGSSAGTWQKAVYAEPIAVKVDADYTPLFPTFGLVPAVAHLQSVAVVRSEAD